MTTLTLGQLLAVLGDCQFYNSQNQSSLPILSATSDSRLVTDGALFVAVQGGAVDGHRFLADAQQRGAVALLGEVSPSALQLKGLQVPEQLPYIQVENARLALAICSAQLHGDPSRAMTVIGVTGTDGKTTTASLLEAILAAATRNEGNAAGAVGVITTVGARIRGQESDTGFHVTTPDAPAVQHFLAQMRDAGCRYAVVESTSHGLAQDRVAAVDFDIAIVTNITHEHLDYHGTRAAYVAAKAKLFRSLFHSPLKTGLPRSAVLNADDVGSIDALRQAIAEEATRVSHVVTVRAYGIDGQAAYAQARPDVLATNVIYAPDATRFSLRWWGGEFSVRSPLIGDFNVYNVLAAATGALALGVDPSLVQAGVAGFGGVSGRMERIDCGQPFLAIVDFAHTPVSLERALQTLRTLATTKDGEQAGRVIAVFGSAGLRDRAKRYLMGQVGGRLADFTVITAEDPRTEDLAAINAEIERGVREFADASRYTIVPDRAAALQYAVDLAEPGDIVAAFGKGHERSMCYGETEFPWSDQAALAAALTRRIASDTVPTRRSQHHSC